MVEEGERISSNSRSELRWIECPEYIIALLTYIEEEMERVYWNENQQHLESPFRNTGNFFKNDVFEVRAFSWDENEVQPYNFKYKGIEISWYKHLGRGTMINRDLKCTEAVEMFNACYGSVTDG